MPEQVSTDEIRAYTNARMAGVLTPAGIASWWDLYIPVYGGDTPRQLLDRGDHDKLRKLVDGYFDESFT